MFAPGNFRCTRAWDGIFLDLPVKMTCCDDEKTKEEDLDEEADDDDALAVLQVV